MHDTSVGFPDVVQLFSNYKKHTVDINTNNCKLVIGNFYHDLIIQTNKNIWNLGLSEEKENLLLNCTFIFFLCNEIKSL